MHAACQNSAGFLAWWTKSPAARMRPSGPGAFARLHCWTNMARHSTKPSGPSSDRRARLNPLGGTTGIRGAGSQTGQIRAGAGPRTTRQYGTPSRPVPEFVVVAKLNWRRIRSAFGGRVFLSMSGCHPGRKGAGLRPGLLAIEAVAARHDSCAN